MKAGSGGGSSDRSGGRGGPLAALLPSLLALGAAWRLAGPGTPPLYDGPVVVAPYRYLCIPPGYVQQHPATGTTQEIKVNNGAVAGGGVFVTTDEAPVGQVQVLVNGDDLALPPGAAAVTATITPQPPPPQLPIDGRLNGNIDTVALSAGGQPVSLKPGKEWTIVLRGPANQPTSVVEQDTGGTWQRLQTQPVGQPDVYAANSTTFGTFALVIPGAPGTVSPCRTFDQAGAPSSSPPGELGSSAGSSAGGGLGGSTPVIVALLGGLVLVGAGLFVVRTRRGSAR